MKKLIITTSSLICLLGLIQPEIWRSLLIFLLVGAIPGTSISLSPDIMTGICITIGGFIILTAIRKTLPGVVIAYRNHILLKRVVTIPAFRRLLHTRQA